MKQENISSKSSPSIRTFSIENLGCAKNQVDAEVIIAALRKDGWLFVSDPGEAELIIVNSCGFIQSAKEESIQVSLEMKEKYPGRKLILSGCFAQRYGNELSSSLPELDGIFGNQSLSRITEAADQVMSGERSVLIPPAEIDMEETARDEILSFKGSVFIKISEGCDNGCSYCAIPLIRGALKSRSVESIINEIRELLAKGWVEFNFVGQDLGSFGKDRGTLEFALLLREISRLEGKFWIRLLYMHPDHFPDEVLKICRDDPRILPYFDIPFQHASGKILRLMGRKGDSTRYLALISRIRSELPDAVIRSTFLVGFPGETGKDFQKLQNFQTAAEIDWLGVFSYSREEGTEAAGMQNSLFYRLGARGRERRKESINMFQTGISGKRMERFVGRELDVLVEEKVEEEDLYLGRGYMHAPDVDGVVVINSNELSCGEFVRCRIIRRNGIDLEAVPVNI